MIPPLQLEDVGVSKLHDIRKVNDNGVNFSCSNIRTIEGGIAVDIKPTQVGTQRRTIGQFVVQANLDRDPKTIIQFKNAQCRLFFEEGGVIDASTNIGLKGAFGGEMVVERYGRGQLPSASCECAIDRDVMFKRRSGQQFDPKVVANEVFGGDGGPHIAVYVRRTACQDAVAGVRYDRRNTEAEGEITLRLCGRTCGTKAHESENCEDVFHIVLRIGCDGLETGNGLPVPVQTGVSSTKAVSCKRHSDCRYVRLNYMQSHTKAWFFQRNAQLFARSARMRARKVIRAINRQLLRGFGLDEITMKSASKEYFDTRSASFLLERVS